MCCRCCRNSSVEPCECSISRFNVLQKPYGREAPLPKRCKYHRNAQLCLQTVARAIENKGFQGIFFLMPYFFWSLTRLHPSHRWYLVDVVVFVGGITMNHPDTCLTSSLRSRFFIFAKLRSPNSLTKLGAGLLVIPASSSTQPPAASRDRVVHFATTQPLLDPDFWLDLPSWTARGPRKRWSTCWASWWRQIWTLYQMRYTMDFKLRLRKTTFRGGFVKAAWTRSYWHCSRDRHDVHMNLVVVAGSHFPCERSLWNRETWEVQCVER